MTKAMENCPKRCRSGGRFTGSVLDADSKARKTFSVKREEPQVEVHAERKEGTTMTKGNRLDSLTRLQTLMSHPYGVVFHDIETIRECRPESFMKLEKRIDLETVKSTLENNLYFTVEAFVEDVRTTFSNAMQIFPATDDVHKMATKLSEKFEMGFKTKVESLNPEKKTCNYEQLYEMKQTQKTDSSSHKRKSAASSSGREKVYVVQRESDRKGNQIFVTGTHLVKGKDGKNFDVTVVSSAPEKSLGKLESSVAMSPRRTARIAALMDRFSGTIKKAEEALSASASTNSDQKKKTHLKVKEHNKREKEVQVKVKEQSKREREAQLKEQRKKEREALERMENTAMFSADHDALKELESLLLGHPEFTMTYNSRRLSKSMGEEVGVEEMEEGEIPTC